jgi:hypothetical protein
MTDRHAGSTHSSHSNAPSTHSAKAHDRPYVHLGIMTALSFLAMYVLMYAMIDSISSAYLNLNQFYMAGLMVAPMLLIELVVMRSMYADTRRNVVIAGATILAGIGFFMMIRTQGAIGDRQFLRSMIPHHSGAILMCQEASIRDPDIRRLCNGIIVGQRTEIDQMKSILRRHDMSAEP